MNQELIDICIGNIVERAKENRFMHLFQAGNLSVAHSCGQMWKENYRTVWITGTCDSRLFLQWVEEMLIPNLKKNQIVIMDNASIHKSPKIKEAIEKAGCKLV